jgi:DNA-directed RNA polymerase subunit RPC12/RpoP
MITKETYKCKDCGKELPLNEMHAHELDFIFGGN